MSVCVQAVCGLSWLCVCLCRYVRLRVCACACVSVLSISISLSLSLSWKRAGRASEARIAAARAVRM